MYELVGRRAGSGSASASNRADDGDESVLGASVGAWEGRVVGRGRGLC